MSSLKIHHISHAHLKQSKYSCRNYKYHWLIWIFPLTGLFSFIWFLIRVIPKPSRAAYPCQRVAAPLASSFIIWLAGLVGSTLAYHKARRMIHQSRYVLTAIFLAVSITTIWLSLNVTAEKPALAAFVPTDPPNSPIGVAKGIYPGRVVWVYDPNATNWDGTAGNWWDDANTSQSVVDSMVSKALQSLTGQQTDKQFWDALFKSFNQTHKLGDTTYKHGEKIAIKINANQDRSPMWGKGQGLPSPQIIYTMLHQLIKVAGVPGEDITIYDATVRRYIGDPVYNRVRANADPELPDHQVHGESRIVPQWTGSG